MADQLQLRGGSEADHQNFTGAAKEITVDTTKHTLRVHDGTTEGGHPLAGGTPGDPGAVGHTLYWDGSTWVDLPPPDIGEAVLYYRDGVPTWAHPPKTITIVDSKGPTEHGGTFTAGAWQTRDLNTIRDVTNKPDWVSLGSNQVTLNKGRYYLRASAPARYVNEHAARWYKLSPSPAENIFSGSREDSYNASGTGNYRSFVAGYFEVADDNSQYELQHRCQTTRSSYGFGIGSVDIGVTADRDGAENIFSIVDITRLGDLLG